MGTADSCGDLLRTSGLGDGPHLREGAAASAGLHGFLRKRDHVGRRHHRRQGRLPEGRPDGLRQHLRHGVLFRRGLHRLDAGSARRAHQAKPCRVCRNAAQHQVAGKSIARHLGPGRNAARADDSRPVVARRCAQRRRRHRDDAEAAPGDRSHSVPGRAAGLGRAGDPHLAGRAHDQAQHLKPLGRLGSGQEPGSGPPQADRRLHHLFRDHHRRSAAGPSYDIVD